MATDLSAEKVVRVQTTIAEHVEDAAHFAGLDGEISLEEVDVVDGEDATVKLHLRNETATTEADS